MTGRREIALFRRLLRENHFPRAAAGLAYFLMMTLFPLLLCLYHMLGSLFPATAEIRAFLGGLLPPETVETLLDFLGHAASLRTPAAFVMALSVVLTGAASAYRIIDDVIDELRRCRRARTWRDLLGSFAMSLVFLAGVYLAALLVLSGRWLLEKLDRYIMFLNVSELWTWLRFPLLAALLLALFSAVYRLTAPRREGVRVFPGAAAGALALLIVSPVVALFIGRSARYPLLYGSLASVILMMLWLYLCGMVLFLGAALNAALEQLQPKAARSCSSARASAPAKSTWPR